MSGRAPSTSTAVPIGTSAPAGSPATGARRTRTGVTSRSSIPPPVTASEPVTPVVLLTGVSKLPNGAADWLFVTKRSVVAIGPGALPAPPNVSVIAPDCVVVSPAANWVPTVSVADPDPDAGVTVSQGWLDEAVH